MSTQQKLSIAVTGGSGLVGKRVCDAARQAGHAAWPLSRSAGADARWNVETGEIAVPGRMDALIHLAGRSVADRWSDKVKREVWDSRVPATEKLCAFLTKMPAETRPGTLIAASAIGIYGDRGDEVLTEDSPVAAKGTSFLADVCEAWEAATKPASDAGIRVVHVRIGIVLARDGGALAKLRTPTKLGLGGPVGKGTQFMPWISLTDLSRLLVHLATEIAFAGVINGVGPNPVRQHEFMRALGKVLHRPTVFPLPSFMVKLAFGQMGQEMLLSSMRVISNRMPKVFTFQHTTLEGAMRGELGV
jgi:uncharacterized protein